MLEIFSVIGAIIGFGVMLWVRAQLRSAKVFQKIVSQDNGILLLFMYLAIGAVGLLIVGVCLNYLYEVGGGPIY
ncbi:MULTISPECIES: hypothetical protein [Fictibacillus]|uniref:Uncharacterized protein n=1 Tax=Fictibacillus terranigra TaxID=3058424 RepID=A0ABT8E8B9_9BACL|nr:hypothetical protein [Fictibacillus sp. CENA-BCM004]MDN4074135.1 hypothetical protein [Fictibacillus sp. CENA-BCM004]